MLFYFRDQRFYMYDVYKASVALSVRQFVGITIAKSLPSGQTLLNLCATITQRIFPPRACDAVARFNYSRRRRV